MVNRSIHEADIIIPDIYTNSKRTSNCMEWKTKLQWEIHKDTTVDFHLKIKFFVTNLSTEKTLGTDSFTGEFSQTLKEELTLYTNSSRKLIMSEYFPIIQNKASITLIPKPDINITEITEGSPHEHSWKNPQQNNNN